MMSNDITNVTPNFETVTPEVWSGVSPFFPFSAGVELTVHLQLVLLCGGAGIVDGHAHVLAVVQRGHGRQDQQRAVLQDGHAGLPPCQLLAIT